MKLLAKETWQIAGQNWKNVLLFELLYRGITLPVYLRFVNRALQMALHLAGYSYLTSGNIGSFLIQPGTLLTLVGVCAVGMMMLTLEIAGLITAYQGAAYDQKLSPLRILWGGIRKMSDECAKRNWRLGILALMLFLLSHLFLIVRVLTHVKPFSFVLHEISREPLMLLFVAGVLVFCLAAVVPALFVFHSCMIEQRSYQDAQLRSISLLKKHAGKEILLLAGSNLLVMLLTAVGYGISVTAAAVLTLLLTERKMALATLLYAADRLEILFLFAGSILAWIVLFASLSVLFYQYANRRFHEPEWDVRYLARGTVDRRKLAGFLCAVAAGLSLYVVDLVQNGPGVADLVMEEMQIMAHRGSCLSAPENTMAAVRAAYEELADSVELDVQMTADGVVVLGHDASLRRVAGVNRTIASCTYEELCSLEVGSWFSPEFAGEPIPELEEVLEYCKGKMDLNIEIKGAGRESDLPSRVTELILDHGLEEQCVLTSSSLSCLKQVKELAPQLRTGYVVSAAYGDFYSSDAVDFISIRHNFVDERLVKNVHAQGKAVYAWTVNVKSEMERLHHLGVDGIITDRPIFAREIIYREEATENLLEYLEMVLK